MNNLKYCEGKSIYNGCVSYEVDIINVNGQESYRCYILFNSWNAIYCFSVNVSSIKIFHVNTLSDQGEVIA